MTRPIINIADLQYRHWGHGGDGPIGSSNPAECFEAHIGAISTQIGAQKLGYNLTVIPPGKRGFPRHNHLANEEMFFILEGDGEYRSGDQRYPIKAGDVIACPPGGADTAHHILNTSDKELKVLAVSTKIAPDVTEYPDSGKFAVLGEVQGGDGKPRVVRFIGRWENSGNYWEGEKA
jgi:uncharacterized cupin superfamily protein